MDKELRMILIKYFIIVALTMLYIAFMLAFVGPTLNHVAFGQSAFDVPNQFNNPQYNQFQQPYDQYGQQFQQPYGQYQQPYNDPYAYQQPYQSFQQPYYGMQQPYPQAQNPIQFGTSEVIYTLLGGGALGYARYNQHKRNQDKEIQRDLMAEVLREKQEKRELARVLYEFNEQKANALNNTAPTVKLEHLDKGIEQFAEKVAKA